ncbi:MAG: hypothetical protein ACWA49_01085 [Ruegeria sp.]
MFFHLDSGFNTLVHEWADRPLLVGVAAHLAVNWRAFSAYFKRPVAQALMSAGGIVQVLSF